MALIFDKAPTEILAKYFNYNDIFLVENTTELLKYTKIHNLTIKFEKNKRILFRSIYSLGLMELKLT